jgi:CubicO group peptidase (beta-lactamase class C family)
MIAERVSGQPFDSVLTSLALRPAGIDGIVSCHSLRSDQFVPGVSAEGRPTPLDVSAAAYVGDGGLCANAASLTKWIRLALASADAGFSRLAQPAHLSDGTQVPYGFGLSTREFLGHAMVWHAGNVDSHSTMIADLPRVPASAANRCSTRSARSSREASTRTRTTYWSRPTGSVPQCGRYAERCSCG